MGTDRTLIYVTSGTGNSLRVARWVADHLEPGGQGPVAVVPIERARPAEEMAPGSGQSVVLVAPTHGFTTPWQMLRFAVSLPRGRGNRAWVLVTRAGIKLGPLFAPGIGASNTFLLALILWLKGFRVRGVAGVDMPSNWYSLHPIQSLPSQLAILGRAESAVRRFAGRMAAGESAWLSRGNVLEAFCAVALLPISFLYLFWGRFFLAKLFFANRDCNGCGACARGCPVGAIRMWGTRVSRPYWRFRCESCMRCGALCPKGAVEAGQSWGVALYFLTTLPATLLVLGPGPLARVALLPAAMAVVFVSYLLFHLLNRLRPVNWFFAHTTLTHYWNRYREPGTSRAELSSLGLRGPRSSAPAQVHSLPEEGSGTPL